MVILETQGQVVLGNLKTLEDSAGFCRSKVLAWRLDEACQRLGKQGRSKGIPGDEGHDGVRGPWRGSQTISGQIQALQKLGLCFLSSTIRW